MSQNCGCDKQLLEAILGELLEEKEKIDGFLPDDGRSSGIEDCLGVVREELDNLKDDVSNLVVVEVRGGCVAEISGLLDKQRLLIIDWDSIIGG